MKNLYLKMAADMLCEYASDLGNNGCNDFDLSEVIPDLSERRQFVKGFHEYNGDLEEYNPEDTYENFYDFCIAGYLAYLLRQEIKE